MVISNKSDSSLSLPISKCHLPIDLVKSGQSDAMCLFGVWQHKFGKMVIKADKIDILA